MQPGFGPGHSTYTTTVKILCDAFRIPFESSAFACERRLIEQAFSLNHAGKSLTTILNEIQPKICQSQ